MKPQQLWGLKNVVSSPAGSGPNPGRPTLFLYFTCSRWLLWYTVDSKKTNSRRYSYIGKNLAALPWVGIAQWPPKSPPVLAPVRDVFQSFILLSNYFVHFSVVVCFPSFLSHVSQRIACISLIQLSRITEGYSTLHAYNASNTVDRRHLEESVGRLSDTQHDVHLHGWQWRVTSTYHNGCYAGCCCWVC